MVTFTLRRVQPPDSLTGVMPWDGTCGGNWQRRSPVLLVVTVGMSSEGEEVPVVSFATTSIAIDEGDTNTVAILADGR